MKAFMKNLLSMNRGVLANRSGYILFSLLIIGALVLCVAMSTFIGLQSSQKTAGVQRVQGNVFNIAEAGKEHALATLRLDTMSMSPGSPFWLFNNQAFDMGNYSVRCRANGGLDTLLLESFGKAGKQSSTIEVLSYRYSIIKKMRYWFNSAVSTRADVKTLGNITIDGNDWDSTNSSIVGPGTYGISTCKNYTKGGASIVYGRGFDSTMTFPLDSVVADSLNCGSYPNTPEEVLGLPVGSLDTIKTNTFPTTPFHGIYYLDSATTITGVDFQGSSGILIIHNSATTAMLKNISGEFKGIIICDQVDHFNDDAMIVGAVITLSNNAAGNCFGNGAAHIRFSSQILKNIDDYITNPPHPFFVDVLSWKEK